MITNPHSLLTRYRMAKIRTDKPPYLELVQLLNHSPVSHFSLFSTESNSILNIYIFTHNYYKLHHHLEMVIFQ